ncbi:MAG: hypothetical protein ABIC91_00335 [Nanoarchaeota archaeon]|nr:hypothetical protein [Nanoarchaeota archaeon]MBU1029655.1 hypothetical protein [Nanoarchaeota archaeon]MBU1850154.1 hypothetical protein [Nanoarchaeota archaeon]
MSFVDKLKFWKKEEDFNFDDPLMNDNSTNMNMDLGLDQHKTDGLINTPDGLPPSESAFEQVKRDDSNRSLFAQQQKTSSPFDAQPIPQNKDLELISAKLDTIKAELDAINQRVQKIERIADSEHNKKASW